MFPFYILERSVRYVFQGLRSLPWKGITCKTLHFWDVPHEEYLISTDPYIKQIDTSRSLAVVSRFSCIIYKSNLKSWYVFDILFRECEEARPPGLEPGLKGVRLLHFNHLYVVDGSEIRRSPLEQPVVYPLVLYIPGAPGFLNHQQYVYVYINIYIYIFIRIYIHSNMYNHTALWPLTTSPHLYFIIIFLVSIPAPWLIGLEHHIFLENSGKNDRSRPAKIGGGNGLACLSPPTMQS